MRALVIGTLVGLASSILACGGDNGTGPVTPDLTGSWTYGVTDLSGSGVSCTVVGTVLNIGQSGSTFSGSYSGGTVTCTGPGGTASADINGGVVVNGTVNARGGVSFELDTSDWRSTGTVTGTSMSGTVTARLNVGSGGLVLLSGSWSSSRT